MGKTVKMSFEWKNLQEIGKCIGYNYSEKKKWPHGLSAPLLGLFSIIHSRSQVRDYRTIGPLVLFYIVIFFLNVLISYIYRTPLVYHRVAKSCTGMRRII